MSSTEAYLVEQAPNEKKRTTPEKFGLDAMFAPDSVAVIGATDRPGTVVGSQQRQLVLSGLDLAVQVVRPIVALPQPGRHLG